MAERKTTLTFLGHKVTVTEVPVVKRIENYNEYTLEDGTVIRVTTPTNAVYRIDGEYDPMGNPLYYVQNGTVVTVLSAPAALQKDQTH